MIILVQQNRAPSDGRCESHLFMFTYSQQVGSEFALDGHTFIHSFIKTAEDHKC